MSLDSKIVRNSVWNPTSPMVKDEVRKERFESRSRRFQVFRSIRSVLLCAAYKGASPSISRCILTMSIVWCWTQSLMRTAQSVLDESLALAEDLDLEESIELLEAHLTPLLESAAVKCIFVYNMAPLYRQLANVLEAQAQFDLAIRILKMLVEASSFRNKEYVKEIEAIRRKTERDSVGRRGAIEGQRTIDDIEAEISETEFETACLYRDLGLLFTRAGQSEKGKLLVSKACSMLAEMHFKFMDSKLAKKKKKNKDNDAQNAPLDFGKKVDLLLAAFCPSLGLICETLGNQEAASPEAQHAHLTALTRNSASLGLLSPNHPHYATLLHHQLYDSDFSTKAVQVDLARLEFCIKKHRSMIGAKSIELVGLLLGAATQKRTLNDFDASFALLEEARKIVSEAIGDDSTYYATILLHHAIHFYSTSDFDKAESFAKSALGIKRQVLGDSHIHVAMIQYDLSLILECKGQSAEAMLNAENCIKTLSSHIDDTHPSLSAALELHQRLVSSNTSNNPVY